MQALPKPVVAATVLAALVLSVGAVLPPPAEAGGLGKALMGRVLKGGAGQHAARSSGQRVSREVLRRDAARDAATQAKPLAAPRTVHRYTTAERAAHEAKHGLKPGTHMTPNASRGRPLTADHAQGRYGIPTRPEVRETIVLPKGYPVRHNKALGGEPGRGELTSPQALPPNSVQRVVPLPR